jgi:hypothetical protein
VVYSPLETIVHIVEQDFHKIHIVSSNEQKEMVSKQITMGIGIPMIVVGALLAALLAPIRPDLKDTIEFVGSLIGILGVAIFIAGLFSRKNPQIPS